MKHLGDITKINGAEIPVVDIITGGSPCQDLSVAGLRKGLKHEANGDEETTRSGLFMDQLRIVKEMREHDRRTGRHGVDVRPRYMVWENVPGAFSSNGGKDFQAVLTEIVRIVEPDAPDVPMPDKGGWPKAGCLYGELGNWSIAYRVHDAQYWGVPQRRKRIALIADFNGLSALDILFDPQLRGEAPDSESHEAEPNPGAERGREVQPFPESLSGDSEPGCEAWEGTAEAPAGRSDGAISFQERAGKPGGARESSCRMSEQGQSQPSETNQYSPDAISIQGNTIDRSPKQNGWGVLPERLAHAEQRGQAWSNGVFPEPTERGSGLEGQIGQSFGGAGDETTDVHLCGCGLPERDGIPFCERDSASEGAGVEPQQQQHCEGPEPKFFQNTGRGWWNEGNIAETVRTPSGGDSVKANIVLPPHELSVMTAGFSFGQSAKARSIGYQEEMAPTLRGGEGGNQKPHILIHEMG